MFIQVGNELINLDNITFVDLHFSGRDGVRIELSSSGPDNVSFLEYYGAEAAALRRYFSQKTDVYKLC